MTRRHSFVAVVSLRTDIVPRSFWTNTAHIAIVAFPLSPREAHQAQRDRNPFDPDVRGSFDQETGQALRPHLPAPCGSLGVERSNRCPRRLGSLSRSSRTSPRWAQTYASSRRAWARERRTTTLDGTDHTSALAPSPQRLRHDTHAAGIFSRFRLAVLRGLYSSELNCVEFFPEPDSRLVSYWCFEVSSLVSWVHRINRSRQTHKHPCCTRVHARPHARRHFRTNLDFSIVSFSNLTSADESPQREGLLEVTFV